MSDQPDREVVLEAVTTRLKAAEKMLDLCERAPSIHIIGRSVVEGGYVEYGDLNAVRDILDEFQITLGDDLHALMRDQLLHLYTRADAVLRVRV